MKADYFGPSGICGGTATTLKTPTTSLSETPPKKKMKNHEQTLVNQVPGGLYSIPKLVEFERNQNANERLNELQALHTALYYLCLVMNADFMEVKAFLTAYPEALLLDGTNRVFIDHNHDEKYDESVAEQLILMSDTAVGRSCCSPCNIEKCPCQKNRQAILDTCLLSHDFCSFHRQKQQLLEQLEKQRKKQEGQFIVAAGKAQDSAADAQLKSQQYHPSSTSMYHEGHLPLHLLASSTTSTTSPFPKSALLWNEYRQDIILVEHDIRHWRQEELSVRQQILEITIKRGCDVQEQDQQQCKRNQQTAQKIHRRDIRKSSRLRKLLCTFPGVAKGSSTQRRKKENEADNNSPSSAPATSMERVIKQLQPAETDEESPFPHQDCDIDHQLDTPTPALVEILRERQKRLLWQIRKARQIQFFILSKVFHHAKRHSCVSRKSDRSYESNSFTDTRFSGDVDHFSVKPDESLMDL